MAQGSREERKEGRVDLVLGWTLYAGDDIGWMCVDARSPRKLAVRIVAAASRTKIRL